MRGDLHTGETPVNVVLSIVYGPTISRLTFLKGRWPSRSVQSGWGWIPWYGLFCRRYRVSISSAVAIFIKRATPIQSYLPTPLVSCRRISRMIPSSRAPSSATLNRLAELKGRRDEERNSTTDEGRIWGGQERDSLSKLVVVTSRVKSATGSLGPLRGGGQLPHGALQKTLCACQFPSSTWRPRKAPVLQVSSLLWPSGRSRSLISIPLRSRV